MSHFSGQAVEKANDHLTLIHQKTTHKLDPTIDALKVRKIIEFLQNKNQEENTKK